MLAISEELRSTDIFPEGLILVDHRYAEQDRVGDRSRRFCIDYALWLAARNGPHLVSHDQDGGVVLKSHHRRRERWGERPGGPFGADVNARREYQ